MPERLWFKVTYDFQTPHWLAFGRVAFVRAPNIAAAKTRADQLVARLRPGAQIVRLDVTPSDWRARLNFWRLVQFNLRWKQNVAAGIPNVKTDLWRRRD